MNKWIFKAIIQKAISFLPLSHRINFLFQKHLTKGVILTDEYFVDRLIHAKNHIQAYKQSSGNRIPLTTLELGTGWYPIIPLSLFIAGSNEIYSIDLVKLVNKDRLAECIHKYLEYYNNNQLLDYIEVDQNRIEELKGLSETINQLTEEEILNRLRIKLLILDARHLSFNDNYFDLIHSNNTFEHIHPDQLIEIIKEFKRVLGSEGVMSHFVDMSDHFAHFDNKIGIYNFLKFSDRAWRIIDNSIQPLNRLRITEYEKIFNQLKISYKIINIRNGNLEELRKIKLAKRFRNISNESIAVSHCQFIA